MQVHVGIQLTPCCVHGIQLARCIFVTVLWFSYNSADTVLCTWYSADTVLCTWYSADTVLCTWYSAGKVHFCDSLVAFI